MLKKEKSLQKTAKPHDIIIDNINKFFIDEFHDGFSLEEIQCFPKRFCKYGEMAIFNETILKFLESSIYLNLTDDKKEQFWKIISDTLKVKNIAVVYNVIGESEIRSPNVQLLFGDSSEVSYNENSIKYKWNLREVMFSRGNISEKLRLSNFNCENEIVLDMFAGIGYFTLTYLIHCKAKFLYACEWNGNAVKWLKNNLIGNKIPENRYQVLQGDCSIVAPKFVAQRINLGLIPSCRQYWMTACEALSSITGGILHIHENVNSKDDSNEFIPQIEMSCNKSLKPKWDLFAREAREIIEDHLQTIHSHPWHVKCLHLEHVKSYAPHIDHMVLDLLCQPLK